MKVEREIAGFALPFAAGVIVTAYAGKSFCSGFHIISVYAFAAISIALICLSSRRSRKDLAIEALICAGAIGCGALSAAAGLSADINPPASRLESLAEDFGSGMQRAIEAIKFQSPDAGALIKALLTGNRSSLSPAVTEAFRASGASHILALSGLHLGIIYVIFSKALVILGNGSHARRWRSGLVISLCGFYTLATGAGPSIVRAFIFILLNEIAGLSGRYNSLAQVLLASLILQLAFSPLSSITVGFQLSYAAIAGIAFIFPWLKSFWPEEDAEGENPSTAAGRMLTSAGRWIWTSAALSISCQLTAGPLAYIYFGTFPKHFLLTNLLALPLTGILIPSAVLTLFLSAIGWCPTSIIRITEFLADLLVWLLNVISTLSCE